MTRLRLIRLATLILTTAVVPALSVPSPARAQGERETLIQIEVGDSIGLPLPDAKMEVFTIPDRGIFWEWMEFQPEQLTKGVQLLRFAKPPTIAVSQPATAVIELDEDTQTYVFEGTTIPGGSVTITAADQERRTNADSTGQWSLEVDLRRGENAFEVTATDPTTGKVAETPVQRVITVPFQVIEAPTLTVDQPAEGATFENGAIPVQGQATNAASVVVTAAYMGPVEPAGDGATPAPPKEPKPLDVKLDEDGNFSTPYELTTGRWAITITASSAEGKTSALTRNVSVAFEGVNLVVSIDGGRAWIKVWVDGKVSERVGAGGKVYGDGKKLTFKGRESVEVRTGNSGVTKFTLNGTSLGNLGRNGVPETWLFAPPNEPEKTQRR